MFHCFALGTCTQRKHELLVLVKVNQATALADLNSECHWQKNIRRLQGFRLQLKIVRTSDVLAIAMWSSGCVVSRYLTSFSKAYTNLSHGKTRVKYL